LNDGFNSNLNIVTYVLKLLSYLDHYRSIRVKYK
jgi:UDP-N-acetylmuramyl pentapeptide synthase